MDAFDDVLTSTGDAKSLLEGSSAGYDTPSPEQPVTNRNSKVPRAGGGGGGDRETLSKHPVPEMNHFQGYQDQNSFKSDESEVSQRASGSKEAVTNPKDKLIAKKSNPQAARLEAVASWVEESEHELSDRRRSSVITYLDVESGTKFTNPVDVDGYDVDGMYEEDIHDYDRAPWYGEGEEAPIDVLAEIEPQGLRDAFRTHTPRTSRRLKEEEDMLVHGMDRFSVSEDEDKFGNPNDLFQLEGSRGEDNYNQQGIVPIVVEKGKQDLERVPTISPEGNRDKGSEKTVSLGRKPKQEIKRKEPVKKQVSNRSNVSEGGKKKKMEPKRNVKDDPALDPDQVEIIDTVRANKSDKMLTLCRV